MEVTINSTTIEDAHEEITAIVSVPHDDMGPEGIMDMFYRALRGTKFGEQAAKEAVLFYAQKLQNQSQEQQAQEIEDMPVCHAFPNTRAWLYAKPIRVPCKVYMLDSPTLVMTDEGEVLADPGNYIMETAQGKLRVCTAGFIEEYFCLERLQPKRGGSE